MRITESLRIHTYRQNLQGASSNLNTLYEKLATQKEVLRPSDDPVKTGSIMRFTTALKELEQKTELIQNAESFISTSSYTLDAINDTFVRVNTLAVRAGNGTFSASEYQAIAGEVNEQLESLLQEANTEFAGRYIFAGTKSGSAPFTATRDGDGMITAITYNGNAEDITASIGSGRAIKLSVTGQEAFVATNAFQCLIDFRDHLNSTESMTNAELTTNLSNDLGAIDSARSSIGIKGGILGTRASELDLVRDQNEHAVTRAKEMLSTVNDVDVAELAIELSKEEMVYQALLSASSRIFGANLMDYI